MYKGDKAISNGIIINYYKKKNHLSSKVKIFQLCSNKLKKNCLLPDANKFTYNTHTHINT